VEKALPEPEEADHEQGSMKTHRKIIPIVALAFVLPAFAPASAPASSILSGYGGPGPGTQAILGSTLLNGPSGGGGPQGGVSAALTAAGRPGAAGTVAGTGPGGSAAASPTHAGNGASRSTRQSSGSQPRVGERPVSRLAISRASTGGSGVLGLSNTAFLVLLLALGALVFTGLLTRGLAKPSGTRWHAGS
jgi:hypothetical protein